jgi:NLR family CARD domain-containing protein 3
VSGAQAIAKSLAKNTGVKFLNLFNNKIGFDGAEALKETLKTNNVLEHLELGHNRIRDRGFQSLAEGIKSNPNNSLKILSVRFNFITDDGAIEFFKTIKESKYVLNEVNLKNNSINEYGLYQFKKSFDLH